MSDFSELCPLFTTGVYKELSIGTVGFTGISATMNVLCGLHTLAAAEAGGVKFQRTVVVTKVYCLNETTPATGIIIHAKHHSATSTAAGTPFATIAWSLTTTVKPKRSIHKMTMAANKTFLAADVLGFAPLGSGKTDAGKYSFIVRYKEK